MKFGEKLRERRREKGLTQAQLAELAGISKRTVIYYEQGQTYPQNRLVYRKLADALGVDADYLRNENDEFVASAMTAYGSRGRRQAEELMNDVTGLFAGGDMADEDFDSLFRRADHVMYDRKKEMKAVRQ